jgi:hypothetical protein
MLLRSNIPYRFSALLAFSLAALVIFSWGCREKEVSPGRILLEGRFSMVGNMPFAKLVFRASDGKTYEVVPSEAERFKTKQGAWLRIECLSGSVVLETADKRYSRRVYFVKDIKIRDGGGR